MDTDERSLTPGKPLAKEFDLGPNDSLKVILTTQEGKSAKRPHQAFLLLKDSSSNLDVSYPLSVKESGKAKVDLVCGQHASNGHNLTELQTQKELPTQFLKSQSKVSASLVIASFGSSTGYKSEAFSLNVISDKGVSASTAEKPLRYGKLPEIHHIFRADQKSPNVLISTIFTLGAIAALPILLGAVGCARPDHGYLLTLLVAVPWRQHQSLFESHVRCAHCSRSVCGLDHWP